MSVSGFRVEGSRMIQIMLLKSAAAGELVCVSQDLMLCHVETIYPPAVSWYPQLLTQSAVWWSCVPLNVSLFVSPLGNSRIPVYKHFDSTSHLIPGPALVLHYDGGCGDPSTCSWHPHQNHWSPWQRHKFSPVRLGRTVTLGKTLVVYNLALINDSCYEI